MVSTVLLFFTDKRVKTVSRCYWQLLCTLTVSLGVCGFPHLSQDGCYNSRYYINIQCRQIGEKEQIASCFSFLFEKENIFLFPKDDSGKFSFFSHCPELGNMATNIYYVGYEIRQHIALIGLVSYDPLLRTSKMLSHTKSDFW